MPAADWALYSYVNRLGQFELAVPLAAVPLEAGCFGFSDQHWIRMSC